MSDDAASIRDMAQALNDLADAAERAAAAMAKLTQPSMIHVEGTLDASAFERVRKQWRDRYAVRM